MCVCINSTIKSSVNDPVLTLPPPTLNGRKKVKPLFYLRGVAFSMRPGYSRSSPYLFGTPRYNFAKKSKSLSQGWSTKNDVTPGGKRKHICGILIRPNATCMQLAGRIRCECLFLRRLLFVVSLYNRSSNSNSTCTTSRSNPPRPFIPGALFILSTTSTLPLCSTRVQCFPKQKHSPRGRWQRSLRYSPSNFNIISY